MGNSTDNPGHPAGALPTGRWLLAAALLIAEYVLALFFFDSERLPIAPSRSWVSRYRWSSWS